MTRSTRLLYSPQPSPYFSLSHPKSLLPRCRQIPATANFPRSSHYTPLSLPIVPLSQPSRRIHRRSRPPAMEPEMRASRSETDEADESPMTNPNPDPNTGVLPPELSKNVVFLECESSVEGEAPMTNPNPNTGVLPPELSKNVVFLECQSSAEGGSCSVYLVGTAHVSTESCREVQAVISYLKPQVVFLELCPSRATLLNPQTLQVPTMAEMIDMWKKKKMNTFGIIYSWFLAKIADKLEVFPGAEFRVAFEEARSYGAKIILGDRPLQITLRRTWGKMSLWHRAKFIFYTLFQAAFLPSSEDLNKMLKELDNADMLTLMIQELSKEFPTLMETLVYERDLYMSASLLKFAREHSSVVAVLGRGHLAGVKKHWNRPFEEKHLMEIPTKSPGACSMKILASLGVAAAGVAIASGIYLMGKR